MLYKNKNFLAFIRPKEQINPAHGATSNKPRIWLCQFGPFGTDDGCVNAPASTGDPGGTPIVEPGGPPGG